MPVWLIVSSDRILNYDWMGVFNPCSYHLAFYALFFEELDGFEVGVRGVSVDCRQFIFYAEVFEEADDVFHDENELFVTIEDLWVAFLVLVEINLPVSIAIKRNALQHFVLSVETSRKSLLFMDILSSTTFIQEVWVI